MKASLIIAVLLIAPSCALNLMQMQMQMSDLPRSILDITEAQLSLTNYAQYPFQNPANCNPQRLNYCQYSFNDYLGISTDADWRDPSVLAQELLKLYMTGPDGLIKVCRAHQLLYACLASTYWSCFNPLYLIGRNFGVANSFQFSSEMLSTFFMCTGGMEQSINQWQCIGQVYNSSTDAINACVTTFNNSINTDPSFNNFCQATQVFMTCIAQPYAVCGPEVQWWACEDVRVSFSLFLCTDLQCPVNYGGSKGLPVAGFDSVVDDAAHDGSP